MAEGVVAVDAGAVEMSGAVPANAGSPTEVGSVASVENGPPSPESESEASAPLVLFTQRNVIVTIFTKLSANLALRHVFPFAPFLAEELDVSLDSFFLVVAVGDATGLSGLFMGPVIDRFGTFNVFRVAAAFMSAALLANTLYKEYVVFLCSWVFLGLGFNAFNAAVQTTVGSVVPRAQLGRVTGWVETSWAGSALVGFPIVGVLIQEFGWHASFAFLLSIVTVCSVVFAATFPGRGKPAEVEMEADAGAGAARKGQKEAAGQQEEDKEEKKDPPRDWASPPVLAVVGSRKWSSTVATLPDADEPARPSVLEALRQVFRRLCAWGSLLAMFTAGIGQSVFFANYGTWLEDEYDLDAKSVGYTTFVIGSAELIGTVCTSTVGPRLQLRRSVLTGALLEASAQALLIWLGSGSLWSALVGVGVVFLAMEFFIVSSISYFSVFGSPSVELRGTVMALFYGAFSLGRTIGSLLAERTYSADGITAVALVCGGAHAAAAAIFFVVSRGATPTPDKLVDELDDGSAAKL